MQEHVNPSSEVKHHIIAGNKIFPNNLDLPVLVYQAVLSLPESEGSKFITEVFKENGWQNAWTNGIYTYHHYHSNSHEVLGVVSGKCMVLLGGDDGVITTLEKGDVIVIPAGVAHKNAGSSPDFECVGAYPGGQESDIKKGGADEDRAEADENVKKVRLPSTDPVFGKNGPVLEHWKHQSNKKEIETRKQF